MNTYNRKRFIGDIGDISDSCNFHNYDSTILNTNKKQKFDLTNLNDDNDDLTELCKLLFTEKNNGIVENNANRQKNKNKLENLCKNPMCDHKSYEEDSSPINFDLPMISSISSINDLITLGKSYHCKKNTQYAGMNLRVLCNLVAPLTELSGMVGMESVKQHIVNQILFFLQGNHNSGKCNQCIDCVYNLPCLNSQTEMLHTAITGPPGVGKTEFGKILGKVYKEMGILSKGTFKLVTRADLIAGYLGQTAIKTQKVIDEARGGVLFIDEAYSLGNSELRDSFSKECIDTLNQNLSERRDFLCIIAGYEKELEKCFFNYNEGLRRRFSFRYNFVPYDYKELLQIFEKKINLSNWEISYKPNNDDSLDVTNLKINQRDTILKLFKKNNTSFPNFGGDMETLLLNCKIAHTKRCTFSDRERRVITVGDIEEGLQSFVNHRKYHNKLKDTHTTVHNVDFTTNTCIYSNK